MKYYIMVEGTCAPTAPCVMNWKLTGRCLATPEARKFWMKEKNDLSYPGSFKAKRIFACHVCWSTKQTEKYDLFV